MGIEIRPTKVSDQIGKKATLLEQMKEGIDIKKEAAYRYLDENALSSRTTEAEKTRVAMYPKLLAGIEYSAGLAKEADQAVMNAFWRFEGKGVVSEDEWKEQRQTALDEVTRLKSEQAVATTMLGKLYEEDNFFGAQSNAGIEGIKKTITSLQQPIQVAQGNADFAEEMLNHIYSYCAETNNLHADKVKDINLALANGVQALEASSYDVGLAMWPTPDETWLGELQKAVRGDRDILGSATDFYDGEVNVDNVRTLMGIPFELWDTKEQNAMMQAYDHMWTGDKGNPDLDALSTFISSCYVDGREGTYAVAGRLGAGPTYEAPKFEKVLPDAFKDFAKFYARDCEGRDTSELEQRRLRGGFLSDVSEYMGSIWVSNKNSVPEFEIGYISKENAGGLEGDTDPLAIAFTCKNLTGAANKPYETVSLLSGSGNHKLFLQYLENTDLSNLGEGMSSEDLAASGLNVVFSVLGKVGTDTPGPVKLFFKFADLSMGAQADITVSRAKERIENNSTLQNYLEVSGMQGTVSIVNGRTSVNCLGYHTEGLPEAAGKFSTDNPDYAIEARDVIEGVEEYCQTGKISNQSVRKFLIETAQHNMS